MDTDEKWILETNFQYFLIKVPIISSSIGGSTGTFETNTPGIFNDYFYDLVVAADLFLKCFNSMFVQTRSSEIARSSNGIVWFFKD